MTWQHLFQNSRNSLFCELYLQCFLHSHTLIILRWVFHWQIRDQNELFGKCLMKIARPTLISAVCRHYFSAPNETKSGWEYPRILPFRTGYFLRVLTLSKQRGKTSVLFISHALSCPLTSEAREIMGRVTGSESNAHGNSCQTRRKSLRFAGFLAGQSTTTKKK